MSEDIANNPKIRKVTMTVRVRILEPGHTTGEKFDYEESFIIEDETDLDSRQEYYDEYASFFAGGFMYSKSFSPGSEHMYWYKIEGLDNDFGCGRYKHEGNH